jgi:hypothetical protein
VPLFFLNRALKWSEGPLVSVRFLDLGVMARTFLDAAFLYQHLLCNHQVFILVLPKLYSLHSLVHVLIHALCYLPHYVDHWHYQLTHLKDLSPVRVDDP